MGSRSWAKAGRPTRLGIKGVCGSKQAAKCALSGQELGCARSVQDAAQAPTGPEQGMLACALRAKVVRVPSQSAESWKAGKESVSSVTMAAAGRGCLSGGEVHLGGAWHGMHHGPCAHCWGGQQGRGGLANQPSSCVG